MRVAWVGEEQGWRPVLEAAGLEVVPGEPGSIGQADVVVCWGPWPAGLPWPSVPVVWCPAGACGTPGDPAARADVILAEPVRAVDLLRGVEEAVGLRLARLLWRGGAFAPGPTQSPTRISLPWTKKLFGPG